MPLYSSGNPGQCVEEKKPREPNKRTGIADCRLWNLSIRQRITSMATKKENREKGTTKRLNLCFRPRQQSLILVSYETYRCGMKRETLHLFSAWFTCLFLCFYGNYFVKQNKKNKTFIRQNLKKKLWWLCHTNPTHADCDKGKEKKKERKETSNKIVTVIWKSLSSHVLIGLLKVMTVCPSFSRIERRV